MAVNCHRLATAKWFRNLKPPRFSMKTNTISDVVTTDYGYHIIKLLDVTPARKFPTRRLPTKSKIIWSSKRLKSWLRPISPV